MDQARVQEIMDRWVMPTEESSYMGGLDKRPILTAAHGSTVVLLPASMARAIAMAGRYSPPGGQARQISLACSLSNDPL